MSTKFQNKPKSAFLYPCIPASVYSCFSPNEPNLVRRAYVGLRDHMPSRGIEPDRVRPNEANYPVYPVNPVKKRNEPNFLKFNLKMRV